MKKVKLFEQFIAEATTSWSKMMKGVRAGNGGPWSIVAIQDQKVVGQSIDIKIQDLIPAKYEALKAEFPKAKLHIEDGGGEVVWNESFTNEANVNLNASHLSSSEYQKAKKLKGFNAADWKWNGDTELYDKIDESLYLNEKVDMEQLQFYLQYYKKKNPGKKVTYTFTTDSPKGYIILVNGKVLKESLNEAKDANREELMNLMETKYGIKSVRPSEDFDGQTEGIWIAADNDETLSGNKIFDYYSKSAKYKNGVLKTVVDSVEKKGWWFSWNDPGTMMIWPKN